MEVPSSLHSKICSKQWRCERTESFKIVEILVSWRSRTWKFRTIRAMQEAKLRLCILKPPYEPICLRVLKRNTETRHTECCAHDREGSTGA